MIFYIYDFSTCVQTISLVRSWFEQNVEYANNKSFYGGSDAVSYTH